MAKPMSQARFLERAYLAHGDEYDYSQTVYVNMQTKVAIVCRKHGVFMQSPQPHLKGQGCPICGREKQKQTLIDKYGVDNPMKLRSNVDKAQQTNLARYGTVCPLQNESVHAKAVATMVEKYGVEYPFQSPELLKQFQDDMLMKYGVTNPGQLPVVQEKIRQHFLERYGVESALSAPEVREKILMTNQVRYGGNAPLSSSVVRDKVSETLMNKYGVTHIGQVPNVIEKIRDSKRANGTFHSSESEEVLYCSLVSQFGEFDIVRQYKSDVYPFACDFYIKSLDLYIELNASWTHGGHWFDSDSDDDVKTVDLWTSRGSDYYQNAVHVWTNRDVQKREIARRNGLNYVVFWDCRLSDAMLWFSMGCPLGHDYDSMYSWQSV